MNRPLKVLVCNERFLVRFGVDRILILLARYLSDREIDVRFACLRSDRAVLGSIASNIEEIAPPEGLDPVATDGFVADRLVTLWRDDKPDVLVTGGWPFFTVAARAGGLGIRSIFIDAGAVPHDHLPEWALGTQRELRRLRQQMLGSIGAILPISDFIRDTQTIADRGSAHAVETVLLGGDHLADVTPVDFAEAGDALLAVAALREAGHVLLLALGRFENFGYKNSAEIFGLLDTIAAAVPMAHLLILSGPDAVAVPERHRHRVTCLPTISDAELLTIMGACSLGLSMTHWEGFNLPIAEMQYLDKPVLAYAIGAHPEVIADPWLLSDSLPEMARKAITLLENDTVTRGRLASRFLNFRQRFRWEKTLARWTEWITGAVAVNTKLASAPRRLVLIDVTNSARDPANSGVIRVARRLSQSLTRSEDLDIVFVTWVDGDGSYALVDANGHSLLASNAGPIDWLGLTAARFGGTISADVVLNAADPACGAPPILFVPEVILNGTLGRRIAWARQRSAKVAAIFYDMLPIYEARYVDVDVANAFPAYVGALARADALWAISQFSLGELERYAGEEEIALPSERTAIWLPGQFSDQPRAIARFDLAGLIEILCVSTIEPRKNHRVLIEAFRRMHETRPDLPVRLMLVGNSYGGAKELADWVRRQCDEIDAIQWFGIVSDYELGSLYRRASFSVYPSLAEGFGLPIMESLWMGVPCLCHEGGVMAELAADGGCLPVDMTDVDEVRFGLERLASDAALRQTLALQAKRRRIATWLDYADDIGTRLRRA